ncbi:MAG TPA: HNH endonuclease signature motif containing protein [Sphingomonas sp.]
MADYPYNTSRWKALRLRQLAMHPTCEGCEAMGRLTPANTVDHRVPIKAGGAPFPGHDGLASLCGPCHGAKTARGVEAGAIRSTKPRKGCDADGKPLDPTHPWSGKSLRADRQGTDAHPSRSVSFIRNQFGGDHG